MTTAIRRYCTYIQSTFVPLNTIRRDFGLFSCSQKCKNKKIFFSGFDLSDLLYFAINIQKQKRFFFDFRFCFEVMVILYEKHAETSPSNRCTLLDNMYKKWYNFVTSIIKTYFARNSALMPQKSKRLPQMRQSDCALLCSRRSRRFRDHLLFEIISYLNP